jgi:hypothetical protein
MSTHKTKNEVGIEKMDLREKGCDNGEGIKVA